LVGIVIAIRTQRTVLYDDAAIIMRYAHRIAGGDGWTYNDLDRTNGSSAPLYTTVLAAAHWLGRDLETTAKAVGIVCYASTVGLVAYLASRIAGVAAGALAALFLIASIDYRTQALSGMEAALTAVLGLLVLVALLEGRDNWAGVLLGLALLSKLDAGLLALGIAVCYLLLLRRPPWRIVVISAAVLAPWLLFSLAYFGSPLPYGMTQKLTAVGDPASSLDRSWIFDAVRVDGTMPIALLAVAALGAVPWLARVDARRSLVLATCVAWALLHGLVYSFLDLGDQYPWYKTVLFPPLAIGAACALGLMARAARAPDRAMVFAVVGVVVIVAVGLPMERLGPLGTTARTVARGHELDDYEAFEVTRRAAGRFLARVADGDDVIENCYGWIAYEAIDNPISETETCSLNTRRQVGEPRWLVVVSFPGHRMPAVPPGGEVRATFTSDVGPGGQTFVISVGREDDGSCENC
jgi:hypothetical protein